MWKQPKIILVVVSLALSILIGVALSQRGAGKGAAADASRGGAVLVGLSMDTLKEARWQRDRDYFQAEVEKLGAKALIQSANSDDTRQIQDVKSLIAAGVDALVIVPHNGAAMAEGVRLAVEAGIPTIAYDRLITDCDLDLYISFDNVRVGELQARWMIDHLPGGKGRIVRIYGAPTDHNALLFKEGQDKVLKPLIERGDITVLHEDWATDWDPANAKKIMNAAITQFADKIDAVLASNDGTAGGAIQALKEAQMAGKTLVTGQDAEAVACQRIVRGTQSMTIYKPLQRVATRAAQLAVAMGRGKPVIANGVIKNGFKDVPAVLVDTVAVDRDNMRATVIADGFLSEKEVYEQAARAEE